MRTFIAAILAVFVAFPALAQNSGRPANAPIYDSAPRIINRPSADQLGALPNKGFDIVNDAVARWFSQLKRPATPLGISDDYAPYVTSCCGKGDGYPIAIIVEPTFKGTADDGVYVVLDGTQKAYPDGTLRPEIAGWRTLAVRFPGYKETELKYGNPTKNAWAFLSVIDGKIRFQYCVVPLPPGM